MAWQRLLQHFPLRCLLVGISIVCMDLGRIGVLAQAQTELEGGEASNCYCNSGEDCSDNHTCPRNYGCEVRLDEDNNMILQYCVQIFVVSSCVVEEKNVLCCDDNICNRCPNLYGFNSIDSEEMYSNLTAQLPKECNYLPYTTTMVTPESKTGSPVGGSNPSLPQPPLWLVPILVLAVIFVFMMISTVIVLSYVMKKRCKSVDVESIGAVPPLYDSSGTGLSQSGESGALVAGKRLLQMKTISGMVHLEERIAKGGFGEVWKANWEGNVYAVKVFRSMSHEFWLREGEIYKTCMLAHRNILNFVSMDTKISNYGVDYWLIFDYHDNGSLSSYIANHTLSRSKCLKFLISIATGLSYLHRSIYTSTDDRKPVIAHRDLKPNNILVKRDMTCCIGDLGLAVKESDFSSGGKIPNPKQGTKRYLAPEILAETIRTKNIQSYVMADIYSFSLIIWGVARRNEWHGDTVPHEVPYNNVVPSDPTLEDMRLRVVDEKYRPPMDTTWKNDEILSVISRTIHECWREDPQGRLNAVRVMKNLQAINVEAKQSYTSNEE